MDLWNCTTKAPLQLLHTPIRNMLEERQYKPFLYAPCTTCVGSKQKDFYASSNPVTTPLIISLTGYHLLANSQLYRQFKYTSAKAGFSQMQFAGGSAVTWMGIVHVLFEVEGHLPWGWMTHISDWSIYLACFLHILGTKIVGSCLFLMPLLLER